MELCVWACVRVGGCVGKRAGGEGAVLRAHAQSHPPLAAMKRACAFAGCVAGTKSMRSSLPAARSSEPTGKFQR